MATSSDLATLGHRVRHFRTQAGLTLDALGSAVSVTGSQLSLIENGKREPKLSLLTAIADAVNVPLTDLLTREPPSRRAALELELLDAQAGPLYSTLGLPMVKPNRGLSDDMLESIVGLHRELQRRASEAIATPEEARRANTELRAMMRARDNYLPDIEKVAEERVTAAGHSTGALTHRTVGIMAEQLGFELLYVNDLPNSARSITDLENGRIYLPPASIPGGHGLRSMALQAMAHRLLGHTVPTSYAQFLTQRLEINYFAACCLMPQTKAVAFLSEAKKNRNLAVEDFRDAFGVTHEAAGLRLTNLATSQLDMKLHFLRVTDEGMLQKGYENDSIPLPSDVTGSIEGQRVCRKWSARSAFARRNRTTEQYQFTDTPVGTFWCSTQTGSTTAGEYSISVGVPFDEAKWFRGRETQRRAESQCPDESCCQRPSDELAEKWRDKSWPSARLHTQVLAPLPSGRFPGVDDNEVYDFLDRHAMSE
ncbi:helix-turn-helix transcriptional regulator [Paramicrobacterium fandaimingii]|uniref:helix-turn-helix transcriptional regulator n=1 Tax=Paramicrobacterium fandaimingii TaxID=2708079 RepID=UPI0014241D7A|nr:helix-turn-helix transcriptional regulator [Microbacterium fandaimingii]